MLSNCSFLVLASNGAQFNFPMHTNCQSQSEPQLVDLVGAGINVFKLMSEEEKMNRQNYDNGSFVCEIYKGLQMFRLLVLMPSCCPHCTNSEEEIRKALS